MHIADGVLPLSSLAAGWAGTVVVTGITLRKAPFEDLSKAAVMTAGFFVASLIHVPLGPTSVHLTLNGLLGIVLGPLAFPAILVGLFLQALLFQHGGLLSVGANALMLGLPALLAALVFHLQNLFTRRHLATLFAFLAGALAIACSGIILALWLTTAGREFWAVARLALMAHLPLMPIEGLVCAGAAVFLEKVKPDILYRPSLGKNPLRPLGLLVLMLFFVAPSPAQAHKLLLNATPQADSTLAVQAFFPDGAPAQETPVTVTPEDGSSPVTGQTDSQGNASFTQLKPGAYRVEVGDPLGHRMEKRVVIPGKGAPASQGAASRETPPVSPPTPVTPAASSAPAAQPPAPSSPPGEPIPWTNVLAGLGFIFGVTSFIMVLKLRAEIRRHASRH